MWLVTKVDLMVLRGQVQSFTTTHSFQKLNELKLIDDKIKICYSSYFCGLIWFHTKSLFSGRVNCTCCHKSTVVNEPFAPGLIMALVHVYDWALQGLKIPLVLFHSISKCSYCLVGVMNKFPWKYVVCNYRI